MQQQQLVEAATKHPLLADVAEVAIGVNGNGMPKPRHRDLTSPQKTDVVAAAPAAHAARSAVMPGSSPLRHPLFPAETGLPQPKASSRPRTPAELAGLSQFSSPLETVFNLKPDSLIAVLALGSVGPR